MVLTGQEDLQVDSSDSDSSEDEDPIVIKMIASQMARKISVKETLDVNIDISLEKIKEELKKLIKLHKAAEGKKRQAMEEDQRMALCDDFCQKILAFKQRMDV